MGPGEAQREALPAERGVGEDGGVIRRPSPRALTWARRVYVVALVALAGWLLLTSGADLRRAVDGARPALLVAVPFLACGQLILTSMLWRSGLRALGRPVPAGALLSATARSAPARYLPGSVWFAATRVALLRRHGAGVRTLSAVATLEMLLVPVVGFALGGAVLALSGVGIGGTLTGPLLVVAVALLGLASPPVVNAALRFRAPDDADVPVLSWPALLRLVGWTAGFWVWAAAVFALYVAAFPGLTDRGPLAVAGGYAVAWGVGWLAIFAPQGLGVFEVTLTALVLDGAARLAVVLAGYRALIAVRDVGVALVAGLAHRSDSGLAEPADAARASRPPVL